MSQSIGYMFAAFLLLAALGGLESRCQLAHQPFSEGLTNNDEVIIGGKPATRGQFPHQGALFKSSSFRCGCSLLNEQYALTAAHCTYRVSPTTLSILFGATKRSQEQEGTQKVRVSQKYEHPDFSMYRLLNDVAVMKFSEKIVYSEFIKPVALTTSPDNVVEGTTLVTSGWGKTSDWSGKTTNLIKKTSQDPAASEDLMYVNVTVVSRDECAKIYGNLTANGAICVKAANTTSVCYGDSGGPLIYVKDEGVRLVGVTSFTHKDGCESNNPGGFHRVQLSLPFITNIIGKQ